MSLMSKECPSYLSDRWAPLASTIQIRMDELGLGSRELASRAEVSRPVVDDLKRGTAKGYRPDTLLRIAQALHLHPFALVAVLAGDEAARAVGAADPTGRVVAQVAALEHVRAV